MARMATVMDTGQYAQSPLDDFKRELEAAQRWSVIDDRRFVLASRISHWLRAPHAGNATPALGSNARRILEALYGRIHDGHDEIDLLLEHMAKEDNDCWLRVFAILLQIDHNGQNMGRYIFALFKQKILDASIGHLSDRNLEDVFRKERFDETESKRLASQFTTLQWELCTRDALHTQGRFYTHGSDTIIPVTNKIKLKEGGTGELYIVEVPAECIPQTLAEGIESNHYTRYNDDGTEGEVRQFALKVLKQRGPYEDERKAYQSLRQEDGIVRCLGSWELRLNRPEKIAKWEPSEYYLLLEYGAYDLSDFFSLYPSPSTTEEILRFWEALSHLLTALQKIHNCRTPATKTLLLGWHCDIKPANIIYCNDGRRKGWKIADPGFATFKAEAYFSKQEGLPVIPGKGGTSAYGGPECPDGDHSPVSQRFDIWSLGCVFSEAATWVALGHRGIQLFQLVRKSGQLGDNHQTLYRGNNETAGSRSDVDNNSLTGIHGLDRFHDGSRMSSTVKDWHEHVRQALRRCDPVTEKILEIVESNMLQADPRNRGSAFEVAEKVGSCLQLARQNAEKTGYYKVPSYFKLAINQEQQQESQIIQDRMAQEGSEEWRHKYRSKAFIEATREPLLGGSQLDDHEGPWDTSPYIPANIPTRNLQRSTTCLTGFGHNSRNTFHELTPLRTQHESSQPSPDVLCANYMQARRLLELAGWNSGTLEIPKSSEAATEPTKSPQNAQSPMSSTYSSFSLRSPQGSTQPSRSKSNRRPMSLIMRKVTGTFSKSKLTSYPSSSALSPVDSATLLEGQGPIAAQQSGGRMKGRENSESSIHRYEKFDTYFKGRDIAFLIDNAPSMDSHWIYVKDLLSVLVAFLYEQDDDGMDLYFTSSKQLVGTFREPKEFVEEMSKHRPNHGVQHKAFAAANDTESEFLPPGPIPRAATASTASSNEPNENMSEVLDGILEDWCKNFMEKGRKLTLIILTDGVWPGVTKKATVTHGIIHTLERAQNKKMLRKQLDERGLSLQFVRFGHDEAAIDALERMDDDLRGTDDQPLPDIIDHEPADGNIYKMILGSLDSKYDENTRVSIGDGDDDRSNSTMTLIERDEHGEPGESAGDLALRGSVSYGSRARRVSTTGRTVSGSGAGFDRPRQAQTMQVEHMSRQNQPR